MDRKGFTLVEMLATIFILSLILGIATYGIVGIINNSKKKSEEIFVGKIGAAIEDYIGLYGSRLIKSNDLDNVCNIKDIETGKDGCKFEKCVDSTCSEGHREISAYEYLYNDNISGNTRNLTLKDIVDANFFDRDKLINPVNKLDCLVGVEPVIRIFKDSDYVYYYYIDLSGSNTSCEISDDNGIINTLPNDLSWAALGIPNGDEEVSDEEGDEDITEVVPDEEIGDNIIEVVPDEE